MKLSFSLSALAKDGYEGTVFYGNKFIDFITQPILPKSVRETQYATSPYLAEYYCTLSNAALLGVGLYYQDYSSIAAASFSILSHAIPSQRLHDLDLLGSGLVGLNVACNYQVVLNSPSAMAWGGVAIATNFLDTYFSRHYPEQVRPWLHVTWHLMAGFGMYQFNKAKVAHPELAMDVTPSFLLTSFKHFASKGLESGFGIPTIAQNLTRPLRFN